MSTAVSSDISTYVRVGAAGALGAVTLLWAGLAYPGLFQAGTVLLVISLVPLARGLGCRAGAMVGLLLGILWVAARLGFDHSVSVASLLSEVNVIVIAAMMTIGGLAGSLFGSMPGADTHGQAAVDTASARVSQRADRTSEFEATWREALVRHREWLTGWDRESSPWTSFDNHVRELLRLMSDMRRIRCYRVSESGALGPLGQENPKGGVELPSQDLLTHVVTTGRRFVAGTASAGPLIQQLANGATSPVMWAVPIRDHSRSIGLVTAEGSGQPINESRLDLAADFIEEIWLHVHHLDLLRTARSTDRGSGLINRTDFLNLFKDTLEQCYQSHEPVVVMVVCLEGLRGLDDASQWSKRDALIEAVGQTIAKCIRKDDLVGRFSDAQFVALLRRLDVPLAELICRKMLGSIAKVISDCELATWITPRAGLSGSGFSKPPAEALLRHAIAALQKARTQDVLLVSQAPQVLEEVSRS
ncbi:MAG TPA: diguanylate cyclase [Phycisphaerae bacterium]|nr:diguanylate cyclase [Phycisphaerae bacterium]HOJ74226.1 diguanylate cyclase [Phycisphaerae bacterium]HOM51305.1 diguanylate cyclase [Phycisphaerae bacterium]HON67390.1 diguanylate cyclase [Phycisphaerae bacterium]HOQ86168.1 diguanylate cyclase [Phycisphaerae bacterium]